MNIINMINAVKKTYENKHKFNEFTCTALLDKEKLPFHAYLVGKVMGDGHLDYNYNLIFVSGCKKDLEDLLELVSVIFEIPAHKMSITKRTYKGTSYSLRINYALLARILFCLGAPKGNKTKQSFFVPNWILLNQAYKRMFLMALLEDELCTIKIARKNHGIKPKFKMAKQEHLIEDLHFFLNQLKSCIESFGVQCSAVSKGPKSKLGQKTKDLYFDILRNKRNIIKFEEVIGFFLNKEKKEKLKECCSILRSTLRPEVDRDKIIALRKKGLSVRQIASRIPHEKTTVHRVIKNSNI